MPIKTKIIYIRQVRRYVLPREPNWQNCIKWTHMAIMIAQIRIDSNNTENTTYKSRNEKETNNE